MSDSQRAADPRGSGSDSTEPRFLVIGMITRPHGVRGEMRVAPYTDDPERFALLSHVYLADDPDDHPEPQRLDVESTRMHQRQVLVKLAGIDDRDAAAALRGSWLLVPREEALPLAEGEYYLYQLSGLSVVTVDGESLGTLVSVLETGANNVFVVRGERGEVLLPDVPEIITEIDFTTRRMTVTPLPGLLP